MAVYRHLVVDIPTERVTIESQSGGKPALIKYVLEAPYDREKGYAKPRRTTIGHQCVGSKTKMHPTSQYAEVFPTRWEALTHEKPKAAIKRIGMFTALQAINSKIGIKDALDSVYGDDKGGAILDYAMHSILHHTNELSTFEDKMRLELLYSKAPYSDSYYSKLFEEQMSREQELLFKKKWALQCKEDGVESVWICIDGSNDDCESKGVEIAEKGHAKSGKNVNIVSFTYAVTNDGKPVTYEVYRGGLVDAKAMKMIIDFLQECGITVSGVILDRGYCDANAIQYLVSKKIAYIIMVKSNPEGYDKMVAEYGEQIKMNTEYLIPHTYLFGIQKEVQLFKRYEHKDWLTLFYDYQNGNERITTLLKNIYREMKVIEEHIQKGEPFSNESKFRDFISVTPKQEDDRNTFGVVLNTRKLQEEINEKGLYGIVSSNQMSPAQVHHLYVSRSSSETEYRLVKGQLGYGKVRVQHTQAVHSRFEVGFVSSIVRYEIETASAELGKNTNQMVQELEKIEARKINDVYTYTHTEKDLLSAFFKSFGLKADELINESVKFENDRLSGQIPLPRRRKTGPKKGSHHKKYDDAGNVIPRKSGVKSGTKRSDTNLDGSPRKKPGVKPGTKRGMFNKDGSLRKKPGPKGKTSSQVTSSEQN